jgi:hypothetical protein
MLGSQIGEKQEIINQSVGALDISGSVGYDEYIHEKSALDWNEFRRPFHPD